MTVLEINNTNKCGTNRSNIIIVVAQCAVAQWRSGAVAQWRSGAVAQWRSGAVAQWRSGAVAQWRSGAVAQWRSGAVAQWRSGAVAQWRSGAVAQCAVAQWRSGAVAMTFRSLTMRTPIRILCTTIRSTLLHVTQLHACVSGCSTQVNEYLCTNSLWVLTAAWLDASQRSRESVHLVRSARK